MGQRGSNLGITRKGASTLKITGPMSGVNPIASTMVNRSGQSYHLIPRTAILMRRPLARKCNFFDMTDVCKLSELITGMSQPSLSMLVMTRSREHLRTSSRIPRRSLLDLSSTVEMAPNGETPMATDSKSRLSLYEYLTNLATVLFHSEMLHTTRRCSFTASAERLPPLAPFHVRAAMSTMQLAHCSSPGFGGRDR